MQYLQKKKLNHRYTLCVSVNLQFQVAFCIMTILHLWFHLYQRICISLCLCSSFKTEIAKFRANNFIANERNLEIIIRTQSAKLERFFWYSEVSKFSFIQHFLHDNFMSAIRRKIRHILKMFIWVNESVKYSNYSTYFIFYFNLGKFLFERKTKAYIVLTLLIRFTTFFL